MLDHSSLGSTLGKRDRMPAGVRVDGDRDRWGIRLAGGRVPCRVGQDMISWGSRGASNGSMWCPGRRATRRPTRPMTPLISCA